MLAYTVDTKVYKGFKRLQHEDVVGLRQDECVIIAWIDELYVVELWLCDVQAIGELKQYYLEHCSYPVTLDVVG